MKAADIEVGKDYAYPAEQGPVRVTVRSMPDRGFVTVEVPGLGNLVTEVDKLQLWVDHRDEYEVAADEIRDLVHNALVGRYGESAVRERTVGFFHVDAGILGRVSVVIA